jgi:exosortase H (IPTLxxWG-CTERM-specific)
LQLLTDRCLQVNDKTGPFQQLPIFFFEDRAATGGKQQILPGSQDFQHFAFPFTETGFAFNIEDQVDAGACLPFQVPVTIKEFHFQPFCNALPNGCFTGPHWTNQVDVRARFIHGLPVKHCRVHSGTTLVNIAGFFASLVAIFMIRFFVLFTVLLVGLFTLEILQPAEEYVIMPFTSFIADVSVWILQIFDDSVESYRNIIRNSVTGFGVRIERGCNGVEALIILFAAIFSFPAPFKNKIIGFVIGFFAIQVLNLVRIISLFYLGQWNQVAFEWFHLYLWQALIILDALVVWLIWLRTLPQAKLKRQMEAESAAE